MPSSLSLTAPLWRGMACREPRETSTFGSDAANAKRVYAPLVAFGAPLGDLGVIADDFGVPPRRIDVLTVVDGLDSDAAWQRRFHAEAFGLNVPFLSLEDMLRNKEHVRRDKDIGDISAIRAELRRRGRE